MSISKQLETKLKSINLSYKDIKCYGNQITVECISKDTCIKWSDIIGKFAKIRGIIESITETKESIAKNNNNKNYMTVYRLYACIN